MNKMDVMNVLWKDVESKFVSWDKEGHFIEGLYVERELDVGPNNSNVYLIETPEGSVRKVWGTTMLDELMDQVPQGCLVRITYLGLGKPRSGQNPPKLFKVQVPENKQHARQTKVRIN